MSGTPAVTRDARPPLLPSERRAVASAAGGVEPPAGKVEPVAVAAAPPAPVPADTIDRRTTGEKQRAALIGSNLGAACVVQAGDVTVLRAPAAAPGPALGAQPAPAAADCTPVAPALEGAVAATNQAGVAPGTVGALAAVERVQASTITPQTEGMIAQGSNAVVVPGNYNAAVESLADTIAVGRDRFLERHPELRAMQRKLVEELNERMGGNEFNLPMIMRIADMAMAREVLKANGITDATANVPGERTIAMFSREQRLAAMPNIVQQIIDNPTLLPPEARAFLQKRFPEFMGQVGVMREIGRTVRNVSEREEIARMIEDGTIPLNASVEEIQRIVQQMRTRGVAELRSANAYSAADRGSAIRRMERDIPRPVEITPQEVLVIGQRVAKNHAESGVGRPTYRDPTSGTVYALSREASAAYAAGSNTAASSGEAILAGGLPNVQQALAARQRLERLMDELLNGSQRADLVRLDAETASLQRYLGQQQLRANKVTSAANLGDASIAGVAALHARSASRFA